jgi:hypothetical protein
MKTLETARAEAESIATRWVPAHMTARSGLVDDIAAALLGAALVGFGDGQDEGRSLVEEAQADAKHWQEQVEMLSAVGTGVLTEQSTELEAAQADAKSWMERSIAIQKQEEQAEHELDRLKGELAEARAMVLDACAAHASDCRCEWCAFLAATPAEQAQGEGAKACRCGSGAHPRRCAEHPWAYGQHLNDLSLQSACDDIEKVNAQVAALAKRVDVSDVKLEKLDEWSYRIIGDFLKWQARLNGLDADVDTMKQVGKRVDALTTHMEELDLRVGRLEPAPPPPEAAGSGHAFCCMHHGKAADNCASWCKCLICGTAWHPSPAVPPIAEGAKP